MSGDAIDKGCILDIALGASRNDGGLLCAIAACHRLIDKTSHIVSLAGDHDGKTVGKSSFSRAQRVGRHVLKLEVDDERAELLCKASHDARSRVLIVKTSRCRRFDSLYAATNCG